MIPLLRIAGETGTLLAEFKKKIRDKESYEGFKEKAEEELGDILWYLSNIASRLNLSLSEIASKNLQKTNERWPIDGDVPEMPSTKRWGDLNERSRRRDTVGSTRDACGSHFQRHHSPLT